MYDNLILSDMEIRIENMIFGWHEKLPEMFIELLNTLVLTKDEQDVRGVMEVFVRKELFNALFAFGYGAHHLWVYHKKNKIKSGIELISIND